MKLLHFTIVLSVCCFVSCLARAEHQVALRGIVNVSGQQVALLQIDNKSWVLHVGEHFTNRNAEVELLALDVTNEVVRTRVGGAEFTNSLPVPERVPGAESWIHLQDADFWQTVNIYSRLCRRTALVHPEVSHRPISSTVSWKNQAPNQAELIAAWREVFQGRATSVIEDGEPFLQVIPSAMSQTTTLGASNLPPAMEIDGSAKGVVDFEGLTASQVIPIYGKLVNRECKAPESANGMIWFRTTGPLSKTEVIYALETLLAWNGNRIVPSGDKSFIIRPESPH